MREYRVVERLCTQPTVRIAYVVEARWWVEKKTRKLVSIMPLKITREEGWSPWLPLFTCDTKEQAIEWAERLTTAYARVVWPEEKPL